MSTGVRTILGKAKPFAPLLAAAALAVTLMATHQEIAVAGAGGETELASSLDHWSPRPDQPKVHRFAHQPRHGHPPSMHAENTTK
jgi:hypothetical protein